MNEQTIIIGYQSKEVTFDSTLLGATVRTLRERLGLTQTQLGVLASLSTAEISKLETGSRKKLPRDTLVKISPHLNVSVDFLLAACMPDSQSDYEHFYDYTGKELDLYKIAKNLYSVDSELLILLSSADFLSDKEFIIFLKSWIKLKLKLDSLSPSNPVGIFKKIFEDLKIYCTNVLQRLTEAVN